MCNVAFIGPAISAAGMLFGGDDEGGNGAQMIDAASAAQSRLLDTQNRLLSTQVSEFESPEATKLRKDQITDAAGNLVRKSSDYDRFVGNRQSASDIAQRLADPDYLQGQVDAVSADTAATSDAADANQRAQLRSLGVDPSSPAAIAAGAGQGTMRTLGMVNARNNARRTVQKDALNANMQVGGMQRGLTSDASSATTAPSTSGVQSSISGMTGLANAANSLDQQSYQQSAAGAASLGNMIQGAVKSIGGTPPYVPSSVAQSNMGANWDSLAGYEFAEGGEVRRPRMLKSRYAEGGEIEGPGGPTDDEVPAMIDGEHPAALSNGEFVVKADTTQNVYGPRTLESVNRGKAMVIDEDQLAEIGRGMVTSLLSAAKAKPRTLSMARG